MAAPGVMLATRGTTADLKRAGWVFELKVDGIRCVATIDSGVVELRSRSGGDITAKYPEVVTGLAKLCPVGRLVLDGEIACTDDHGLPSWPLTHKRNAQTRSFAQWAQQSPASFFAFDVLHARGDDIRGRSYRDRRTVLESLDWQLHTQLVPASENAEAMWEFVVANEMEGLVAKDPAGIYVGLARRSAAWVKIKRRQTVSCMVGGYDRGDGARASSFGALHLFLVDPVHGTLVQVGKVGSGFNNRELKEVSRRLATPPLIVEVEYLDVSPSLVLRQPTFLHVRDDLEPADCTTDQL